MRYSLSLFFLLISFLSIAQCAFIENGDFEDGNVGFTAPNHGFDGGYPNVCPYIEKYGVAQTANCYGGLWEMNGDHTTGDGNAVVYDLKLNDNIFSLYNFYCTSFNSILGEDYRMVVWLYNPNINDNQANLLPTVDLKVNGIPLFNPFTVNTTPTWKYYENTFVAIGANTNLCLYNASTYNGPSGHDVAIDDVCVEPILDSVRVRLTGPDTICQGEQVEFEFNYYGFSGSLCFEYDDGTTTSEITQDNGESLTLSPTSNTSYTFNIDFCTSSYNVTYDIVVESAPSSDFNSSHMCDGDTNEVEITGDPGGYFELIPPIAGLAYVDPDSGYILNAMAGADYNLQYTVDGAGSCVSSTTTIVSVFELDVADFSIDDFCDGTSNSVNNNGTLGGSFSFNIVPTDGAIINSGTGEVSNYTAGTSYDIKYVTTGACPDSITDSVFVKYVYDAFFTSTDPCFGDTNEIDNLINTNGVFSLLPPVAGSATVNSLNGEIYNPEIEESYVLQYTISGDSICETSFIDTVIFHDVDDPSFTIDDFCDGDVNTVNYDGYVGGEFSFNTAPMDGAMINSSTGELSNYTAGETYDIKYVTTGACPNSSTDTVFVKYVYDASFTSTDECFGDTNIVSNVINTFGEFSLAPPISGAATVNASNGDIYNPEVDSPYFLKYTISGNNICETSFIDTVVFYGIDDPSFTIDDFCDGDVNTVNYNGYIGGAFSFNTTPIDAAVINANTGELSNYTAGETYDIKYVTLGACPDSTTDTVLVKEVFDPTFNSTNPCEGDTNEVDYRATFGGTFSLIDPIAGLATVNALNGEIYNPEMDENYLLEYTISGNGVCETSFTDTVVFYSQDTAEFSVADFCDGTSNEVDILGTEGGLFSLLGNPNGAAINAQNGVISNYLVGTSYQIQYTTQGVCPDSSSQTVMVIERLDPTFVYDNYCEGSLVFPISNEPNGTYSFDVDPLDGASIDAQTGLINNGVGGTTYEVQYTVGECLDSTTNAVMIYEIPSATLFGGGDVCDSILDSANIVLQGTPPFSLTYFNGSTQINAANITQSSIQIPVSNADTIVPLQMSDEYCQGEVFGSAIFVAKDLQFSVDITDACPGIERTFTVNSSIHVTSNCTWNFGDGTTSNICGETQHVYDVPGCYDVSLSIEGNQGCITNRTFSEMVCVEDLPIPDFNMEPRIPTYVKNVVTLYNSSAGEDHVYWTKNGIVFTVDSNRTQLILPPDENIETELCLIAETDKGCQDTLCRTLSVEEDHVVYVPNTFTPNGDDKNEYFAPIVKQVVAYDFYIFNRWGDVVWETHDTSDQWDGRIKGNLVPQDVYVWKMDYIDFNGFQKSKTGSLLIMY